MFTILSVVAIITLYFVLYMNGYARGRNARMRSLKRKKATKARNMNM